MKIPGDVSKFANKVKNSKAMKAVMDSKAVEIINETGVPGKIHECVKLCSNKVGDSKVSDSGKAMKKCIEQCSKN